MLGLHQWRQNRTCDEEYPFQSYTYPHRWVSEWMMKWAIHCRDEDFRESEVELRSEDNSQHLWFVVPTRFVVSEVADTSCENNSPSLVVKKQEQAPLVSILGPFRERHSHRPKDQYWNGFSQEEYQDVCRVTICEWGLEVGNDLHYEACSEKTFSEPLHNDSS